MTLASALNLTDGKYLMRLNDGPSFQIVTEGEA